MRYLFLVLFLSLCYACTPDAPLQEKASGAGEAMEFWSLPRTYPDGRLRGDRLFTAFTRRGQDQPWRSASPEWESLGPKNIGGRTLCLAFHPDIPSVIYAGSAGGGLWKTTTAGSGVEAWTRVPTGYPVQAVGAIAIDPTDADVLYLGTGEVYNYTAAQPGVANRLTRGLYGFGILKSINGGESWDLVLDWSQSDLTGVWEIIVNPERPQTVYAATTEGVYRSYDAGDSWVLIHDRPMAMDLELSPQDTSLLFASHGSYLSPERGVYRSTDGGESFQLLPGLPLDFTGKTMLTLSPSAPGIIYASVGDAFESRGLFRSDDNGESWLLVSDEDVAKWQGWYSHDVAVKPDDPNQLFYGGIDIWRSDNGGTGLTKVTTWSAWTFGQVPIGGPEGPPHYVHADIHALYFHPAFTNVIYAATDGGVFVSTDGGLTWEGRNGGYQTQQFYANFGHSTTNPDLGIGGMQDNSTAIYTGSDAWTRVLGGDGMSAAVDPLNDNFLYGSAQNLNIYRSNEEGNFSYLFINTAQDEARTFNGPFELAPSEPATIYAGAQRLHVSHNRGTSWSAASSGLIDNGNPVLTIAVGPEDSELVYVSTAPFFGPPGLFRSTNGGAAWDRVDQGLPDRVITDIAIDPADPAILYVAISGFGSPHLYRTTDGGNSWAPLGVGQLPDVPASNVLVDPLLPDHLFVGNDLGVYASLDGGASWEWFSADLPDAAMIMHLGISADRQLRAATHGLGLWQKPLPQPVATTEADGSVPADMGPGYPNPTGGPVNIPLQLRESSRLRIWLSDAEGKTVKNLASGLFQAGEHLFSADLSDLPAGVYQIILEMTGEKEKKHSRMVRPLVVTSLE